MPLDNELRTAFLLALDDFGLLELVEDGDK